MPVYKYYPTHKINNNGKAEEKIRTLSLVLTHDCNLRCKYCYELHKDNSGKTMPFSLACEAIADYLNRDDEFETVVIDLFGGEPLLDFHLIQEIYEYCHTNKWKKPFHITIGTNGTLLNDIMKEWFSARKENLTLALSLDGCREAHNLCRENSYDQVSPHLDFIKEHWPQQPLKMTISAETIPFVAQSVIELEEKGFNFTANVVYEDIWGTKENKEKLLEIYEQQLNQLVAFYIDRPDLFPVNPLLSKLPEYLALPGYDGLKNDCVRYCGAGHEMVVVDMDGKRYPCHRFLPWVSGKSDFPMGPVNRQKEWLPIECTECKIVHSCPTCAGFNWQENNDCAIRTRYHCEAHKLEVIAAAMINAHRLTQISESFLEQTSPLNKTMIDQKLNSLIYLIENGV